MDRLATLLSPRARLLLGLTAAVALAILLDHAAQLQALLLPLQRLTAAATFAIVSLTGLEISLDGILLSHPDGFRIEISYGCTPVVPAIFIVSLLTVGLHLTLRERLAGLAIGLTLITLLNLFRVAALYYIGVATPHAFAIAHEWLGEAVIVVGTAAVVAYWVRVAASEPLAANST